MKVRPAFAAVAVILLIVPGKGSIGWSAEWNESVNEDLSNNGMSPTIIPFSVGSNITRATTGGQDAVDYLTFTIEEGHELSSIMHRAYAGADNLAFISIMSGTEFTESRSNPNPQNFLGWTHFGRGKGNVGDDLLVLIGRGAGSPGFTPPLPSGSYSVWLQQLGSVSEYELEWIVTGGQTGIVGDFDGDGALTLTDIDGLGRIVVQASDEASFDLNDDGFVNQADIHVWVKDLFGTWTGDANLDREFNSTDLIEVLAAGTYEADVDSVWSTGDFNGDGRTNSSDLIEALSDGGYEQGPRTAAAVVPEPGSTALVVVALAGLLFTTRKSIARRGK